MQIAPAPILANIIRHYLILENDSGGQVNYRLFSDGNTGMVFHFGIPFWQISERDTTSFKQPESFVYGQISHFQNTFSNGKVGMLIVVFQPYGVYALSGISAGELRNSVIPLKELIGAEALQLEEQVLTAPDHFQRIQHIENFLIKRVKKGLKSVEIVQNASQVITFHKGLASIEMLCEKLQVGERQLERKFNEHIGISPKHFSGIVRLQAFLKLLQAGVADEDNLTQKGYEAGFYDQAHTIREFRKNAGLTPRQYLSQTRLLAINFMQLPD